MYTVIDMSFLETCDLKGYMHVINMEGSGVLKYIVLELLYQTYQHNLPCVS